MAYTYKKLSIHLESDIFWGNGQKKECTSGYVGVRSTQGKVHAMNLWMDENIIYE